ncbi:GlcG protein [Hahella sp. CCB-MM4]|uniref:GlcG/HbpS family heme-binding protein n=1 Tax=Hahella sp. (strain CCB-MM4) TaxID=1926491 RepID=UPI000B9B593B|nr:heme-binding protein [Hahella sp. CCB-MM4]OZG73952.1 GlcG protein [Hahella sp. CCB-MM4]
MTSKLTLQQSDRIIDAALRKGRELNAKPLTVAVLDDGGHLKAFRREDQTSVLRPDIAIAKAWGAIGLGISSRELGQLSTDRPAFFASLASLTHGKLIPAPGGILILNHQDEIIGAVGITGDVSDVDECCAIAGVEAAELKTRLPE